MYRRTHAGPLALLATAVLFAACAEDRALVSPEAGPESASFTIDDAAHGGSNEHFYFLPPMVPDPAVSGVFDGALSPTVEICELDASACAAVQPAGFPLVYDMTSGPDGETVVVSVADQHYKVNWHTDVAPLDDAEFYRINVTVDGRLLGFADVDVVNSGKDLKNVDTDQFIALKDGRTLPIKFRIEEGALDNDFCEGADIVACWSFDEGAGQAAADASGNGNNGQRGTTGGADASDPDWLIPGAFGNALSFDYDGASPLTATRREFVFVPNDTSLEPAHVSVEAWVRAPTSPGTFAYMVGKGGQTCSRVSYGLYTGFDGGTTFYVAGAGGFFPSPNVAPSTIWDGQWHHVVGTYDEQNVRLYLDGVEVGSGSPNTNPIVYNLPTYNDLYIGSYEFQQNCTGGFRGDIDDVVIWSRALTPAEVAARAVR